MSSTDKDISNQQYPNEIVIPMNIIRIEFNYPLSKSFIHEFKSNQEKGFTRAYLAKKISESYQLIYKEEIDYFRNNPLTDKFEENPGPYGIWGHVLGDLVLCGVNQKKYKENLFGLNVDS